MTREIIALRVFLMRLPPRQMTAGSLSLHPAWQVGRQTDRWTALHTSPLMQLKTSLVTWQTGGNELKLEYMVLMVTPQKRCALWIADNINGSIDKTKRDLSPATSCSFVWVWIGDICLGLSDWTLFSSWTHECIVDVLSDSCVVSPGHYETLLQSNVVRSLHHTLSALWYLHM